jgi:hypothetical protein
MWIIGCSPRRVLRPSQRARLAPMRSRRRRAPRYPRHEAARPARLEARACCVVVDEPLGHARGVAEHVSARKLRLLATCGNQRDPAFPGSPTLVELGYPGLVMIGWNGLLAPAGTPADIVNKLSREIGRHLSVPEFRDRMASLGADPSPSTPEAFAAFIRTEAAKWQKVIRAIGLEHSQ